MGRQISTIIIVQPVDVTSVWNHKCYSHCNEPKSDVFHFSHYNSPETIIWWLYFYVTGTVVLWQIARLSCNKVTWWPSSDRHSEIQLLNHHDRCIVTSYQVTSQWWGTLMCLPFEDSTTRSLWPFLYEKSPDNFLVCHLKAYHKSNVTKTSQWISKWQLHEITS